MADHRQVNWVLVLAVFHCETVGKPLTYAELIYLSNKYMGIIMPALPVAGEL